MTIFVIFGVSWVINGWWHLSLGSICFDSCGSAAHCNWVCCPWSPNDNSLTLNANRCHRPIITQLNLEQTVVKSFSFLLNHKTSTQNLIPLLYYYFLTWLGWQSFWRVTVVITNFVFSNDVDVSCETAHFSLFTFVRIMSFRQGSEWAI